MNYIVFLLYSEKKHEDTRFSFHNLWDNIAYTLTIGQTIKGIFFGGYIEVNWESKRVAKKVQNAFYFSLKYNKKYLQNKERSDSIFCSRFYVKGNGEENFWSDPNSNYLNDLETYGGNNYQNMRLTIMKSNLSEKNYKYLE